MKNQKPADYSDAELLINEKRMKAITLVFAGVLLVSLITIIITIFTKGFTAVVTTPIVLLPLLVIYSKIWKDLKEEKKLRNL